MTRAEAAVAFNHVLDIVLDRGDASPLKSSLLAEGITDIFDLNTINDNVIDALIYEDPADAGKFYPVKKGDKMLLRCFLAYKFYLESEGVDIDYKVITQVDFDNFRISPAYRAIINGPVPTTSSSSSSSVPTTSTASTSSHTSSFSPVDMFRRAIKKDPSLFPTLKDDKYHDVWHRSFKTQAVAQDVSDVLNELYVPRTADDIALFAEKQKYIYAVLESKVLTDRGKAIIRDHEHDFDAQKAYQKIKSYHLKSTKAKMESSTILSYITSTKLGDGTWNGTTEAFIINWQNQVRLYEKHVPPSDHFSDGQKRIMLQNSVNGIDELRQVKSTADHMGTTLGSSLSYDEYITLLLSAASAYDDQFKPKKAKRHVLFHDIHDDHGHQDDEACYDHDPTFDIDCPVSSIQAYATNFRPRTGMGNSNSAKVRMPSDKWFGLDAASKATWDRLDDKAKSIILGYTKPEQGRPGFAPTRAAFGKPPPGQPSKPPFKAQANLHEISAYDFLLANIHDIAPTEDDHDPADGTAVMDTPDEAPDIRLINAATSHGIGTAPPGDIRRVMPKSSTRRINQACLEYSVSKHEATSAHSMSLIDRGANGGVAGDDVRIILRTNRTVDIKGIDNHHVNNIGIGTVGGVVQTQHGPVIAIMHQYALLGKGASIHSPSQLEWYKNDVNDKSVHVPGGLQRIVTLEGYIIPLAIKDGLARLDIRPHTDTEFDTLPHVFLTSELEWDPSVLDHAYHDVSEWGDGEASDHGTLTHSRYDEFGQYRQRVLVNHHSYFNRHDGTTFDDCIDQCVFIAHLYRHDPVIDCLSHTINKKDPDFTQLRPLFGWLSPDIIKKTFMHTTQYARLPTGTTLKRTFKSPHPALNVTRRNEPAACDIVYADVPAIDDGSIAAVIFVGTDTQVTDVYGIKSDKQFINTLEDNITQRGAPHKLISDSAQVIIGNKVQDILRTLCIDSWQSEPYQQHQNAAERRYQTIKRAANRVLDRSGAPDYTWLLCLQYVCFLLNHTYNDNIQGVPLQHLTGDTPDISVLLRFHFWQKVYYKKVDGHFPSDSVEDVGHIVGISDDCGHALTYNNEILV